MSCRVSLIKKGKEEYTVMYRARSQHLSFPARQSLEHFLAPEAVTLDTPSHSRRISLPLAASPSSKKFTRSCSCRKYLCLDPSKILRSSQAITLRRCIDWISSSLDRTPFKCNCRWDERDTVQESTASALVPLAKNRTQALVRFVRTSIESLWERRGLEKSGFEGELL